ncbi:MAG TPA: PhoH family protein [Bacillota bacterium]
MRIALRDNEEALRLFGYGDSHLRRIEDEFPVHIVARGNEITVQGPAEEVDRVRLLFDELLAVLRGGQSLTDQDVRTAIKMARRGEGDRVHDVFSDVIVVTARGRAIRPKTLGQKRYVEAIRRHGLTFGIGPAGTGKTYLAMAMAVAALREKQIHRIILTRPAVEAGEKLGFLPGDLQEKVDPYLRPLYDALYDILGVETYEKYWGRGTIEVAPLAYMRGRTLDDSFIILDEAQNTTPEQMKMFLTRMGFGSKMVVTGDVTQVDLPRHRYSGLQEARRILADVEGIAFVYLSDQDVVRHPLVKRIIRAYEEHDRQVQASQKAAGQAGPDHPPLQPRS